MMVSVLDRCIDSGMKSAIMIGNTNTAIRITQVRCQDREAKKCNQLMINERNLTWMC